MSARQTADKRHVLNGRAVAYGTITGILASMLTLITIRFVNLDDLFESAVLVLLTGGLWYRTWRWIRTARTRRFESEI